MDFDLVVNCDHAGDGEVGEIFEVAWLVTSEFTFHERIFRDVRKVVSIPKVDLELEYITRDGRGIHSGYLQTADTLQHAIVMRLRCHLRR